MSGEDNPLSRGGEDLWPVAGSVWRQRLRRAYDASTWWLARRHPSAAIRALDIAGRLAHRIGVNGPSRDELTALYDWLPPHEQVQVGRAIAALRLKNRAAVAMVAHDGTAHLARLVRWPSEPHGHELFDANGKVVLACHVGAFLGIRAALHSINGTALVLRDVPMQDFASRSAALKRAVDHVRAGGTVVATIDGPGGTSTGEVECLGRRIVFRRGPFVLSRLTGAPLVPVVCAWTSDARIAVRIAAPIDRPANRDLAADEFETLMAARTARWLDAYLRAEPQEIWLSTLRNFLAAPRA